MAIAYELPAADGHEDTRSSPPYVATREAESLWLRTIDSVAVRNNRDVIDIPEYVSRELDELLCYIERAEFPVMKRSVERHLRSLLALEENFDDALPEVWPYPVPGTITSAVAVRVISEFACQRFYDVHSRYVHSLHALDLSDGLPEDEFKQDQIILRVMVSAIDDVEEGVPLVDSEAVKALGYRFEPRSARYLGRLSLVE